MLFNMINTKQLLTVFIGLGLFINIGFGQQNGSLIHDGQTRSYIFYTPDQSAAPWPLVIALHGYTQTAEAIMNYSAFNELAEEENFLVVYPQGLGNSWNVDFSGGSVADDVGFISTLIDNLSTDYPVDENRIYATGFSNGGFMSYRLAYELPEKIAAIAPVAGTISSEAYASWEAETGKPILHIHGTSDFVVPYNGFNGIESVETLLTYWLSKNNCNSTPEITYLPDIVQEGSTVEQHDWNVCNPGKAIRLLKVINGGHTWPGSSGSGIGIVNQDIKASEKIWEFVKQFSLDNWVNTPENITQNLSIFPNPFTGNEIYLEHLPENTQLITIYNLFGELIYQKSVHQMSSTIHLILPQSKPGIYLLKNNTSSGSNVYKIFKL